jgi:hypothetical protein
MTVRARDTDGQVALGAHEGLAVEMEHGSHDPKTDVTHNDPLLTGKIAWAHINEYPDYYTRLAQMEREAERYWAAHQC